MASGNRINPPTHTPSDPQYPHECRFALEPSISRLIEMAVEAGWDRNHVAWAIMMLASSVAPDDGGANIPQ
jgi:hypothetical protein